MNKPVRRIVVKAPRKLLRKAVSRSKLLGLLGILLVGALVVPGICTALWVPAIPQRGEPIPVVPAEPAPIIVPDRDFNGVPPEKMEFDRICSSGNNDQVYLQ